MFNRKNELIIKTNEIPVNILKKHLLLFPYNMPKYFKDIPSTFVDEINRRIRSKKTVKSCSGFINLFKRSIVFTSPYDIELFIEHNEIRGSVGGHDWKKYFNHHADWQFIDYAKSDYAYILKFCPYFNIQCNKTLIVSNPWWHMNKFEIIPGLINCKEPLDLNIFIPIKKGQNHLYIPQNTPLCYINFETDKQIELIFSDKQYKYSDYQGLFYRFTNLKDKLLKNIIK
tara:strand:+ start:61 stop:744 length:684 start_codon:yes stop_codon:yes gene_type:complete